MWLYISLATAFICSYIIYYRVFHPLAKVPGPFLASFNRIWLTAYTKKKQRHLEDLKLHEKYGPVVRIAHDEVIFSNPDYFKIVYGAGSNFKKGRWYECAVDPAVGDGDTLNMLPENNLDRLRMQKRLVGPTYSIANSCNHEDLIDSTINTFISKMREHTGKPLDMYYWLELFCLDLFAELTYSSPLGVIESESDSGHTASMDGFWQLISWVGMLPLLNQLMLRVMPWLSKIFKMGAGSPVFRYCHNQMKLLEDEAKESTPTPCIYSDLLRLSNAQPQFKPIYAKMMSMTNLGAGIDTTTWTLATFLASTMQNPKVRTRLMNELDGVGEFRNNSKGQQVTYDQAASLSYLQACLFEAQRLYPNLGIPLPRIVPSPGITIDGYFIPKGTTIGMNPNVLSRDKTIFGPDANIFRPDRWLEASKEKKHDMEQRNLAFGGPSRKCPGLHVAWVCMSKFLAALLNEFDIEVLNTLNGPPGPGGHKWVEMNYFVTKWFGWEVRLTERGA